MSRRVRTLIVSGVLFLILFGVALTMPVPYVVLSPGPTLNTLGADQDGAAIITVTGAKAVSTTGHLNLTTVDVAGDKVTAVEALLGWLKGDQIVVPRTAVYPPGESQQQSNQQDTADFSESQDNATAAAFCELGYAKKFAVVGVQSGTGAAGKLSPFDVLTTLDGKPVATQAELTSVLAAQTPGHVATVDFVREGAAKSVTITLGAPAAGATGARMGIVVGQSCPAPFSVKLGLGGQIGGPSAGLMFALGIMDKVGKTDLTKGAFIAGTGEITADGEVRPIGGIQLKMIAARRAGASVFLAPADNCTDVLGHIPTGLTVVKVSTLHEAAQDLVGLQSGQAAPHC